MMLNPKILAFAQGQKQANVCKRRQKLKHVGGTILPQRSLLVLTKWKSCPIFHPDAKTYIHGMVIQYDIWGKNQKGQISKGASNACVPLMASRKRWVFSSETGA